MTPLTPSILSNKLKQSCEAIEHIATKDLAPLSYSQQMLWFITLLSPQSSHYHSNRIFEIKGKLNQELLKQAINRLIQRHEPLRSCFIKQGDDYYQKTLDTVSIEFESHVIDEPITQLELKLKALYHKPFDPSQGKLARFGLYKLAPEHYVLSMVVHHIAADGGSMDILERDLAQYYCYYKQQAIAPIPALAINYRDYARWQRTFLDGAFKQELLAYWLAELKNPPQTMPLPTDHPRIGKALYHGQHLRYRFDLEPTKALDALVQKTASSRFILLLAAFQVWISRYGGQSDILIATPVSGRYNRSLKNLVGMFVNTLAMRTQLQTGISFKQHIQHTRDKVLQTLKYQYLPYELLVEKLNPERSHGHDPLLQIAMAYHQTGQSSNWGDLSTSYWPQVVETVRFDLEVHFFADNDGLRCAWIYKQELWEHKSIEQMSKTFNHFLQSAIKQPEQQIFELPMLSSMELERLYPLKQLTQPASEALDVMQHFQQQVIKAPQKIAIFDQTNALSYTDLEQRIHHISNHLSGFGVISGVAVGLYMEKNLLSISSLLAIFNSGGTYVPLDIHFPKQRLSFMLNDANIKVILTQQEHVTQLNQLISEQHMDCQVIDLEELLKSPACDMAHRQTTTPKAADQSAYILYTSGSSGKPKGVEMPRLALNNLINWHIKHPQLGQRAVCLQFASLSFDVSLQEVFSSLCVGGSLCIATQEQRQDPSKLLSLITQHNIQRLFIPVIILERLIDIASATDLSTVQDIITAGEALKIKTATRDFFQSLKCRIHNHYGPTETHVVSSYTLSGDSATWPQDVPIGSAIDNTQILILDRNLQALPIGVPGELCIAGHSLAKAYRHLEKHNQKRFVKLTANWSNIQNPKAIRIYSSGDKAMYQHDGNLVFLGRMDRQIKLRGFRVEPSEIETNLCHIPGISDAIVTLNQKNHTSSQTTKSLDQYLCAYLVANEQVPPDNTELRRLLSQYLPDYMIPSRYVVLDAFPLTEHGKIDYPALPEPKFHLEATQIKTAANALELQLSSFFEKVLKLHTAPGIDDNFFDLGGHSLLTVDLISKVEKEFHCTIPLQDFFSQPTIAGLANILKNVLDNAKEASQITPIGSKSSRHWSLPEQLEHKLFNFLGSWKGKRASTDSLIVGHNTQGSAPPLFWVFQGENEYKQLAKYLDENQPLYGMRSGHLFMEYNEDNIQSLALTYLEEIIKLCPQGPLFIGGNCQAAIIAEAIAHHLWRRRRTIALLFLMEWSFPFQTYPGPTALLFGEKSNVANPELREFYYPELAWQHHFSNFQTATIPGAHGQFFQEPNIQELSKTLTNFMQQALQKPFNRFSGRTLNAQIVPKNLANHMLADSQMMISIVIHNQSEHSWYYGLSVVSKWISLDKPGESRLDNRSLLPIIHAHNSHELSIDLHTPKEVGNYQLQLLIVEEGVQWFDKKSEYFQTNITLLNNQL